MLGVLVLITATAVVKVHSIESALVDNNTEHSLIQRYAINFRGSAHDRSIAVRDVALSKTAEDRARELAAIERLAKFYADAAGPLEKLLDTSSDKNDLKQLYGAIMDIEARAVASTNEVIARVARDDAAGAGQVLWRDAKPQYEQWLAAINKLIDYQEAKLQAKNKFALEEAQGFLTVMLVTLAIALAGGAWLGWLIGRSILVQLGAEPLALGVLAPL
jgi:methyl-accepting chemotaxis protein